MESIITKEEFHQKYMVERIPINTLAKIYGISQHKMQRIKWEFGYKKGKNMPNPSKEELIEKFINQNKTIKQISKEYKVGYCLVWQWLQKYNIKKPKELLYKDHVFFTYSFKKGHKTWNKGLKGHLNSENCKKTWFTSEELSKKAEKNIGVPKDDKRKWLICLTDNKKAQVNKRNGKTYQHRKRMGYAQYILQKAGIEIPKGYIVYHIDRDYTNNDIGNLEVISRAELLKRNQATKPLLKK